MRGVPVKAVAVAMAKAKRRAEIDRMVDRGSLVSTLVLFSGMMCVSLRSCGLVLIFLIILQVELREKEGFLFFQNSS